MLDFLKPGYQTPKRRPSYQLLGTPELATSPTRRSGSLPPTFHHSNSSFDGSLEPRSPPRSHRKLLLLLLLSLTSLSFAVFFGWPYVQDLQLEFPTAAPAAPDVMSMAEPCGMCASSPARCKEYGVENLKLSRAFTGTGNRLREVLRKAQRGEPIKTGVIGGSVSEGVGVPPGERWHELVSSWFSETFPDTPVSHVVGAVPGRGSEYFMSCHGEHMDDDVDLIVVELGINDWDRADLYFHSMETLLRALLSYPNSPAIILAESFTIALPQLSTGTDNHFGLANFFDVPMFSLRNWLLPKVLEDPALKDVYFFGNRDGTGLHNDYLHISTLVHHALADNINSYFDQQLCLTKSGYDDAAPAVASPWASHSSSFTLPRLRLTDAWDDTTIVPAPNSKCLSLNSHKPESRLRYGPGTHGWNVWDDSTPWRNVKTYLRADQPGDTVTFEVELVTGAWTLYYLRSKKKGLGSVWCWADEDKDDGQMVEGYWERDMDVGEVLPMQDHLSPGSHTLSCEILGETGDPEGGTTFLIIALMYV